MPLPELIRARLREIARESIRFGLVRARPPALPGGDLQGELGAPGAAFVTLHLHGRLRGCIGSLEPQRALAEDVNQNAFAAAFEDTRFPPVGADEEPGLSLHISRILPATPLPCRDEADLLNRLRPGTDGLILQCGNRRATFLPAVWEDLPAPREFLRHLKAKAGLAPDFWDASLRFDRYETESF